MTVNKIICLTCVGLDTKLHSVKEITKPWYGNMPTSNVNNGKEIIKI